MASVFFLSKLRDGVTEESYEKWVEEYDYPVCQANFPTMGAYTLFKVNQVSKDDSPYDYIEAIDLAGIDEYKDELESPKFQELLRQWAQYIDADSAIAVYADPVGDGFQRD